MAVIDIRRRTGYLFLAVVVAHVILISTQVTTRRGVPMLQEAVFGVFSEVQRGANTVATGVRSSWQNYFALQQVQEENEQLKQQISALQIRLQQERNLAQQSESLQKLLRNALEQPDPALAQLLARNGLEYVSMIDRIGRFWRKSLKAVF